MNLFTYTALFSPVLIAIIIVKSLRLNNKRNISLLLTFSGAYLLSITCLHLIPELFEHHPKHNIGMFILLGFVIQIILEYFSEGVEHGHAQNNKTLSISMIVSLCIHALLEGIPLGGHLSLETNQSLLLGIIVHKIPVSIVLLTVFLQNRMKIRKIYLLLIIFGAMTPIGAYAAETFQILADLHNEIIAIVIGVFLYISTTILFESYDNHKMVSAKILFIIIAIGLATIHV
ncbi:MAG: ZIP family metal transporter [Bacteroidota bacterium]|nr:ZIP family metal transporter [Bacteroidota bacterium]